MPNKRGNARRELLIDTALTLLGDHPLESISLAQIAEVAGIPTSSAYHFFENVQSVFAALAKRFGVELTNAVTAPYTPAQSHSWRHVYSAAVDRAIKIYRETPAYCQLILGANTSPSIKLSDRKNDAQIGVLLTGVFDRYFLLPQIPGFDEKMFYSIEIVDLFLSLSYIYQHEIENDMVDEAKEAATAYLERYLPPILPRRDP